jgi:hypothetical protein
MSDVFRDRKKSKVFSCRILGSVIFKLDILKTGRKITVLQERFRLHLPHIIDYQIIASSQEMGDSVSILPLFFILIIFQLVFLKLFWCELFPFMFNSYI